MRARQAGFSLAELLVVVFLGALVLAAVFQTMVVQDRSVRQSYAVIGTQQNLRTTLDVLSMELREVSATDSDIVGGDSTYIDIRAMRKAGIVCDVDSSSAHGWIDVAIIGPNFNASDSLLIFADGLEPMASTDDTWLVRGMSSAPGAGSCTSPISGTVRRLNVSAPLVNADDSLIVIPGALVRSFRRIRYRLVNDGTNGVLTRIASPDSVPLVQNLASIADGGLRFRYWDSLNVAMPIATLGANLNRIGRIQIKATSSFVGGQTGARRIHSDSIVSTIQLRGNRKLR